MKDTAGNFMTADKTWSFTTASAADTTPPTVTYVPTNGATGVAADTLVTGTFTEPVQAPPLAHQLLRLRLVLPVFQEQ